MGRKQCHEPAMNGSYTTYLWWWLGMVSCCASMIWIRWIPIPICGGMRGSQYIRPPAILPEISGNKPFALVTLNMIRYPIWILWEPKARSKTERAGRLEGIPSRGADWLFHNCVSRLFMQGNHPTMQHDLWHCGASRNRPMDVDNNKGRNCVSKNTIKV